jgi:hypothetical protein
MRLLIVAGMLVLTVSASLTPANAHDTFCDNVVCLCQRNCSPDQWVRWLHCVGQGCEPTNFLSKIPPDILACKASCGRAEAVEHLSQSALRARMKAKEAAHH